MLHNIKTLSSGTYRNQRGLDCPWYTVKGWCDIPAWLVPDNIGSAVEELRAYVSLVSNTPLARVVASTASTTWMEDIQKVKVQCQIAVLPTDRTMAVKVMNAAVRGKRMITLED